MRTLMLIPTNPGVGLTTASLGLVRAIDNQGIPVAFYKPVTQRHDNMAEQAVSMISVHSNITPPQPIDVKQVEQYLSEGRKDDLLEKIISQYKNCAKNAGVVIIQGLVATRDYPYAFQLNVEISKAIGAEVIFVTAPHNMPLEKVESQLDIAADAFGGTNHRRVIGCIFNKINEPIDEFGNTRFDLADTIQENDFAKKSEQLTKLKIFKNKYFRCLAIIPWHINLIAPRVKDVVDFLDATIINKGEILERRVTRISLCARSVENIVAGLKSGTLIITAGDRVDVILAAAMASLNGIRLAGLVLTGGYQLNENILEFCKQAMNQGLPVISVTSDTFRTATQLLNLTFNVPIDDAERIERIKDFVANHFSPEWIKKIADTEQEKLLSPAAFRYFLTEAARQKSKKIILPEGEEPRTIEAANICTQRNIAQCILLGKKENITRVADQNDIKLDDGVLIIDPDDIREIYVTAYIELRKHKGATDIIAKEALKDNVTLATMMLERGEVDGLVSGAEHTTANTIRPALQLIKTADNVKLVSSIFFMCLPDQVLVYGDCAVNPNPNDEELADIAIQSADSATKFNITPRVAMISYSTGTSGAGADVDKVRRATEIIKKRRPDILVDGPLQYDAALIEKVALTKAPNSLVAGKATVFIFPDLNTGNTTYKAVQRSADALCIGPMLQGLKKPVNDLSRGATVDDIVYTIAITAIQA